MNRQITYIILFFLLVTAVKAQPYVDLISFNYQSVRTNYTDTFKGQNKLDNYVLNLTAPIRLDSQNTIIVRWFGEILNTSTIVKNNTEVPYASITANNDVTYANSFYASILPIGWQHETKNRNWKYILLAMPKIAGTVGEKVTSWNFQPGAYALATRRINDNLSVKGGLFYNREFFGNFFVPIVSADWKVSRRFRMYGTFPTFYKFEYQLLNQKLYTGIAYKSYTRSFLLPGNSHNYVKMHDMSLKWFLDVYIKKKIYLFAEVGYMLNYGLLDYTYNTKNEIKTSVLYRPDKMPVFINCGMAYRIRFDFDK